MRNVLLVVLDGWGHSDFGPEPTPGNAVELAGVPVFRRLFSGRPRTRLACSGADVGLPDGLMGNSEVGHLNLGAGRVVPQDIVRIDAALADGSLARSFELARALARLRETGGRLHLIGLVSDGGVHSHVRHLLGLIRLLPSDAPLRVHAITDGRDASPTGSAAHLAAVERELAGRADARMASLSGRYWTMDRDRRWERTEKAWRVIAEGAGPPSSGRPSSLLRRRYASGETDEFIDPFALSGHECIGRRDAVILFNYRADRMRQLAQAFSDPDFDSFERRGELPGELWTMIEYSRELRARVAFPPVAPGDCLGEVLSRAGLSQLRVAETEKYAHVTYFFNSGEERAYAGEERILVPSPQVPTYDMQPEMSAAGITDTLVDDVEHGRHDVIVCNFANADMVGHTGNLDAAARAVSTLDGCLSRIAAAVTGAGGTVIVTADHGNAEKMWDAERKGPHTAHTSNPVPVLIIHKELSRARHVLRDGSLRDVAPTLLRIAGIDVPREMTGRDLRTWTS